MKTTSFNIEVNKPRLSVLEEKAEKYSRAVAAIITKKDYTKPESALAVFDDAAYQTECSNVAKSLRGSSHVVLIGIGGSSLGVEAIYHAVALQTNARLHVIDAIEDDAMTRLEALVRNVEHVEDIAICIISKSGATTETITNAAAFIARAESVFGDEIKKRIICIGTEGTDFIQNAERNGVLTATIPKGIGGRYSVFTAAGMVPLSILGIDTEGILVGAKRALEKEGRKEIVVDAATLALLAEGGTHTLTFFTFNERLRMLGFWYRQLVAESIGKKMTRDGVTFSHQILPTVSTSVDLHSMTQLYLGGYQGMFTHFVYGDTESTHHKTLDHWLMRHMTMLEGHTPQEVKNAIREGVLKAYSDAKLPHRITHLARISTEEIGELLATLMFEVMCLCHVLGVDAFDQPNVEDYKAHTRAMLQK